MQKIKLFFFSLIWLFFGQVNLLYAATASSEHVIYFNELELDNRNGMMVSDVLVNIGEISSLKINIHKAEKEIILSQDNILVPLSVKTSHLSPIVIEINNLFRVNKKLAFLLENTHDTSSIFSFFVPEKNVHNDFQTNDLSSTITSYFKQASQQIVSKYVGSIGSTLGASATQTLGSLGTIASGALGGFALAYVVDKATDYIFNKKVSLFWDAKQFAGLNLGPTLTNHFNNLPEPSQYILGNGNISQGINNNALHDTLSQRFQTASISNTRSFIFTVPESTAGFSDIEIDSSMPFSFVLLDYAAEDGDIVDVTVQSSAGIQNLGEVFLRNEGTNFSVNVAPGQVETRLEAIAEGTPPNTGQINITSPVISGDTTQRFNLRTGYTGTLRVLAR